MAEYLKFDEELVRLLDRRPFVPFTIVLSTGFKHDVIDPHYVAMGRDMVVVMHPRSGLSFFRLSHIVSVDAPESVVD